MSIPENIALELREQELAAAYYKLLVGIDWADPLLIAGLREGLNKFLSNAFMKLLPRGAHKYHRTHFVSAAALKQLDERDYSELVYEHLVPKSRYIQAACEKAAAEGTLKVEDVLELLRRYWKTATITLAEDRRLSARTMPQDWDAIDPLARYKLAGITLIPNPFFPSADSGSP